MFRVGGSGLGVEGSGLRVQGFWSRICGVGFRFDGFGFRVSSERERERERTLPRLIEGEGQGGNMRAAMRAGGKLSLTARVNDGSSTCDPTIPPF